MRSTASFLWEQDRKHAIKKTRIKFLFCTFDKNYDIEHRNIAKRNFMSAEQNKQIATHWFAAFNSHHLENLLSLYDENAKHYSPKLKARLPETKGLIEGKDALRNWWQDAFERLPSLRYELIQLTADDQQVLMEYTRHVAGEVDLAVAEVLQIEKGRIVFSRVYHG
jgi:ketosteroid isomerase-like protein